MFDSIQEGIIVIKDENITFMNDLSFKILNAMSGYKNFMTRRQADGRKSKINTIDLKLFYLFKNTQKEKSKKLKKKKSKKNGIQTDASKNSADSTDNKIEFSLREIM
jgi:hypothetical protein